MAYIQTITKDADCVFLTFLNNGKEDRIYPPLRLYIEDDFIKVDGHDSHQISISKVDFNVKIDGLLYTKINLAVAALDVLVQCVNSTAGGSILDPDAARKSEQLLQISEAETTNDLLSEKARGAYVFLSDVESGVTPTFPFSVTSFSFSAVASGGTGETAVVSLVINSIEELVTGWNSSMNSIKIGKRTNNSFYLIPGTQSIPDVMPDFIYFNSGFTFRVYRTISFKGYYEPKNGNKSNVDRSNELLEDINSNYEIKALTPVTYDPITISGNVAETALNANPDRKNATIYVNGADLWLRQMDATDDPTNRKGIRPIENGGSYDLSPNSQNGFYLGQYSVINVADGETPTFYVTESI